MSEIKQKYPCLTDTPEFQLECNRACPHFDISRDLAELGNNPEIQSMVYQELARNRQLKVCPRYLGKEGPFRTEPEFPSQNPDHPINRI